MSGATASGSTFDVIVIGGGTNGLTAATVLARAGRKVLVLESRSAPGGLAGGWEFHPGYRSAGLLHDTTGLLPEVVDELGLTAGGLRREKRPPSVLSVREDGEGLLLHHDPAEASSELGKDAESYARFREFLARITPLARRLMANLPPDWMAEGLADLPALMSTGLALRRLGRADMTEILRVAPMCVADWLDEHFDDPAIKAALAIPALHGYWGGPQSPGTNAALLRYETLAGGAVTDGPQGLVDALVRAAESAGVTIRTSSPVSTISIANGVASGVVTSDGETIAAKLVLSSCDPRTTFLKLVKTEEIESSFEKSVSEHRARGLTAKVNLALDRPLRFRCKPGHDVEFARTAQNLLELERGFDAVKYRRFVDRPALDIFVPSAKRSDAAPPGHASVSILVHGVPHNLEGGWTDEARAGLGDAVVDSLSAHVDALPDSIVGREVLTPADIEQEYSLDGGHVFHGEHGIDQLLVRPARQCARYSTPIAGLYLCGSGSHPGGGITCAPGFNAARTVLKTS